MHRTCILIDATNAGDFEQFQFLSIKHAASNLADVYLVTNKSPDKIDENHLNVDDAEIFSIENNIKFADKVVPGNPDLKLLALLKRPIMDQYDSFVRMEFDCVFSSNLEETIERIINISERYDVGFSSSFPQADHSSQWPWWKTFENSKDATLPPPGPLYAAFLPFMVFNRRFITAYISYLEKGWRGHYELLVPSIAYWESMRVIDFGRSDELHINASVFTVHRPRKFDSTSSQFFHPVKNFDDFKRLPTRTLKNYAIHQGDFTNRFMQFYAAETLSAKEFDLVKRRLVHSDTALVYGAPGVVEVASSFGLQHTDFLTSDRHSVEAITSNARLRRDIKYGNLSVQFINIGKTTSWGNPAIPEEPQKWNRYVTSVPRKDYDIIVVSGRFRVAVAATAYLRFLREKQPDIIITNFKSRDHYQDLLKIYDVAETAGSIVRLTFKEAMEDTAREIIADFSQDYR